MYLKSIEIHGFKSFANKIVLQFHNGITGIVGPNGSGKSNVADAVRWVLGEQRIKQLRGASMQDVIFSGTELRKPMGYAYVAITFDNSDHQMAIDYDEVTVARRIYRSGESEYLLNGTPCRLKDVNELFYDTGIGKEGYSIIGQAVPQISCFYLCRFLRIPHQSVLRSQRPYHDPARIPKPDGRSVPYRPSVSSPVKWI